MVSFIPSSTIICRDCTLNAIANLSGTKSLKINLTILFRDNACFLSGSSELISNSTILDHREIHCIQIPLKAKYFFKFGIFDNTAKNAYNFYDDYKETVNRHLNQDLLNFTSFPSSLNLKSDCCLIEITDM